MVYLLTEPGRKYQGGRGDSEDEVAVKLLSGQMEDVMPEYEEEQQQEEVLANSVIAGSRKDLETLHSLTFGMDELNENLAVLGKHGLVKGIEPTKLGRAAAAHFLSPQRSAAV